CSKTFADDLMEVEDLRVAMKFEQKKNNGR
ncbi:hypothetical protein A2U01_0111801, partial [Trifolium medium]|nr:hypothetical protein [Trifolium medium]